MPPVLLGADPNTPLLAKLFNLWPLWLPLIVGGISIYLLLPKVRERLVLPWALAFLEPALRSAFAFLDTHRFKIGILAGLLALLLASVLLIRPSGFTPETFLFYAFAGLAVTGGALLVTQQKPARAALSFTLVILSVCGLFLLLAAPFLTAATIIIYAGAIIVIFLFVLMLAQPAGLSNADARSREPLLATVTGFLMLATLLYVLDIAYATSPIDRVLARIAQVQQRVQSAADVEDETERKEALAEVRKLIGDSTDETQPSLFRDSKTIVMKHGMRDLRDRVEGAELEADTAELQPNTPPAQVYEGALTQLRETMIAARARLGQAQVPPDRPLSDLSGTPANTRPEEVRRDPDTQLPQLPAENAAYLGRSLFTDYLVPIELGGLLLLVATVGAIAIAQRRSETEERGA